MRRLFLMAGGNYQILFSDIGGVLGTNGWDSALRTKVVAHFNLDAEQVEKRHLLMFDSYERGFLTFDEYLEYVFFNQPRPFELADLRDLILDGSVLWPENIELFRRVKVANGLKFALISNEGQGITEHRVGKFGLRAVADFMVISHCVHMRKPDTQIWQLALDLAQVSVMDAIYVDDREMFVKVARDLGFTSFQHVSLEETRLRFEELGLKTGEPPDKVSGGSPIK
jgi:putative hydrolase of the HAD superfamily